MNDALLGEIVLAYQSQNLRPIRGFFSLHDENCDFACPVVALASHRGITSRPDPDLAKDEAAVALEWAVLTFGEDFTIGLMDGFDSREQTRAGPEYQDGYALGEAAARQLGPREPPT